MPKQRLAAMQKQQVATARSLRSPWAPSGRPVAHRTHRRGAAPAAGQAPLSPRGPPLPTQCPPAPAPPGEAKGMPLRRAEGVAGKQAGSCELGGCGAMRLCAMPVPRKHGVPSCKSFRAEQRLLRRPPAAAARAAAPGCCRCSPGTPAGAGRGRHERLIAHGRRIAHTAVVLLAQRCLISAGRDAATQERASLGHWAPPCGLAPRPELACAAPGVRAGATSDSTSASVTASGRP